MLSADDRDLLEAAIVRKPQPGQQLLALEFRQSYAVSPSTVLVDLGALPPALAAHLTSSDNSCSTASTCDGVGLVSKLSAMARAVRSRSYKLTAASASSGVARRSNTRSRASNLSDPLVDDMVSPSVLLNSAHRTAGPAHRAAGGAA